MAARWRDAIRWLPSDDCRLATRSSDAARCCGQYAKARKEVLDAKNFDKEKRDRIEELLESLAVVKW